MINKYFADLLASDPEEGFCFNNAIMSTVKALYLQKRDLTIVHGIITARGKLSGIEIVHAWAEDDKGFTYDLEAGETIISQMPSNMYNMVGQVRNTVRYTLDEALENMIEQGHNGPWDPYLDKHWKNEKEVI